MRQSADQRFDSKVAQDMTAPHCWNWTGARTKDGYGSFWSGEYRYNTPGIPVMVLAHRWAYERFVGPISEGFNVCHSCDNPSCVRPDHLFLGTQRDNVSDCITKGRHANGRKSLTEAQAESVRASYAGTYGDLPRLAKEFGVSKKVIVACVRGLPRYGRLSRA